MLGQRHVGPDAWVRGTIVGDAPEMEQMCWPLTKQKGLAPGNVSHLAHSLLGTSSSHIGLGVSCRLCLAGTASPSIAALLRVEMTQVLPTQLLFPLPTCSRRLGLCWCSSALPKPNGAGMSWGNPPPMPALWGVSNPSTHTSHRSSAQPLHQHLHSGAGQGTPGVGRGLCKRVAWGRGPQVTPWSIPTQCGGR